MLQMPHSNVEPSSPAGSERLIEIPRRWQDWANPLLAEPFRLEDGHLLIPDRPGNGIEWDEDAIKRYPLDG